MALSALPIPRIRSLGAGLAIIGAVLIGTVVVAPSAWAGHSDVTASVECVQGERILDWSWTAHRHQSTDELPGVVAVEYSEDGDPVVVRTTTLVDVPHLTEGSTTLAPPEGATRVRVHVYAYWTDTTNLIDWLDARTEWLTLPTGCGVLDDSATTTTTAPPNPSEPTTTTVPADVSDVTAVPDPGSTSSTTAAAAVAGRSQTQAQPAVAGQSAVAAQTAVATQTLPDTGSSTGLLAALAVALVALGAGMVAASRRSLHTVRVGSDETPGPR